MEAGRRLMKCYKHPVNRNNWVKTKKFYFRRNQLIAEPVPQIVHRRHRTLFFQRTVENASCQVANSKPFEGILSFPSNLLNLLNRGFVFEQLYRYWHKDYFFLMETIHSRPIRRGSLTRGQ